MPTRLPFQSAFHTCVVCLLLSLGLVACDGDAPRESGAADESRVVVYTSRQAHLIEPLFERFTDATGIEVDFVTDSEAPLIERLAAEGDRTQADVFMTVDAGNLWFATEREVLQPLDSQQLRDRIPENLRDPDDHWFGLSIRARAIVYHPDRVDSEELSTYESLAEDQWEERLCLRTSRKVYNQSLVAMLIEHLGADEAESVVGGWVDNLAATPFSSDTQMIEAVAAGRCDAGIANSYYLGRLQRDDSDYPVEIFWPNQETTGTHINISGAAVTRHAPRPDNARQLIEWLASDDAQAEFASLNLEFPVVEGTELDPVVAAWGDFRPDPTNLAVAGQRQGEAVRLMDRVGYR